MGRGLKIFLWIVGILFLGLIIVGAYGFYTYKQVSAVVSVASDEQFQEQATSFFKGNCTSNFTQKYDEF